MNTAGVIQLGEQPDRVFNGMGIDAIKRTLLSGRTESLLIFLSVKNLMITFHP